MILATNEAGSRKVLQKLRMKLIIPCQRTDVSSLFKAVKGKLCCIRLLDSHLHELVPHDAATQKDLANKLGVTAEAVTARVHSLNGSNPMSGLRGRRLGLTCPVIYDARSVAIFETACEVHMVTKTDVARKVMFPLVDKDEELVFMEQHSQIFEQRGFRLNYPVGTVTKMPRAAVTTDEIANEATFSYFDTNVLPRMGDGFTRDDSDASLKRCVGLGARQVQRWGARAHGRIKGPLLARRTEGRHLW